MATPDQKWSYRPALDGLRSIAVYLVLLFHSGISAFGGGFVGVDLFFVLSGFLVTSIILVEMADTGHLRLGRFYARRVRRLLPAAVVVVAATCLVFVLVSSVARRLPLVRDAQSALLYMANWRFLSQSNDYFGADIDKSPFLHFWSLSIEEQFYFVFPVLLLVLWRFGRTRRWLLPTGLAVLCLASLAAQVYWAPIDTNHAYYGTDARLYQLLAGAILAVVLQRRTLRGGRRASVVAVLALVALLFVSSGLFQVGPSPRGIAAAVASTLLIGALMIDESGPLARLLSLPVPVYLGRISYGTYLWHWPTILVLTTVLDTRPLVIAALAAGIGTGLAALSYQVLEMPIRRAQWLHRHRWSVVTVGLATSALVAVAVVPPVLQSQDRPALRATGGANLVAAQVSKQARKPVPGGIDFKAVAADIGPIGDFCTPTDLTTCIVHKGSGPTIVLIGDSHARMLTPMFAKLAAEHDYTLATGVVSGCPWQSGLVNLNQSHATQENCTKNRDDWYRDVLPKLHPDLVVLSSLPRDDPKQWSKKIVSSTGEKGSLEQLTLDASRRTLEQIERAGARALIIDGLLGTGGFDPLDCLAKAKTLGECEVPVPIKHPPSDAYYGTLAAESPKVFTVNLNPTFCPGAPVCEPMIGRTVVWRDFRHFTTAVTVKLRAGAWRAIEATGALHSLH